MKHATAIILIGLFLVSPAAAQPAARDKDIETVIVTAPRFHFGVTPNAIAHDFVKSFATPTVLRDAIARWQVAICPNFQGLAPQFATAMETRFRTIADQAGAPVKEKGCKPNLSVVFTSQPQTYLDALHARNVDALGYRGMTTISHPIQAWYVTGIQDDRGQVIRDQDGTLSMDGGPWCFCGKPVQVTSTNTAALSSVGGWRDRPDLSSDLLYVTIIVDTGQTGHNTVSEIADYVAMLALSRTEDYDDCQLMPSIANLLSPNCDDKQKPSEITASDIAYLRGIYRMDAGATLQVQQDQISAEMAKSLMGK